MIVVLVVGVALRAGCGRPHACFSPALMGPPANLVICGRRRARAAALGVGLTGHWTAFMGLEMKLASVDDGVRERPPPPRACPVCVRVRCPRSFLYIVNIQAIFL